MRDLKARVCCDSSPYCVDSQYSQHHHLTLPYREKINTIYHGREEIKPRDEGTIYAILTTLVQFFE